MIKDMIVACLIGIQIALTLYLIWLIINLVKCDFTHRNHVIILDAIFEYNMHLIKEGKFDQSEVAFADMEDWDATQARFWDWGYTRILPPEKFELIKPYIKKMKGGAE